MISTILSVWELWQNSQTNPLGNCLFHRKNDEYPVATEVGRNIINLLLTYQSSIACKILNKNSYKQL